MSEVEKSEFLSSVSHEIRTHLNTIVGLSQDIGEYEDIPEEIREDAEDLVTASKELLELMENIINFSKIENNNMEVVEIPYNPKELFEDLAKANELKIEDKPINFHTNIDSYLPYELIGDRDHLEEIINHLLTNAIKYTDGGDVSFNVKSINDDESSTLVISVIDTGRGMKPEEIDKLFNKFERLNIERDTATEDTGLGLAITKRLVELLGGKLKVESTYGEGSRFMFSIKQKINLLKEPDLTRTQRLRLEQINYEDEGYGYKKILIVDDNTLNIKVIRRFLEQYDLLIEECHNGEECLDMIANDNSYDLIFMDIMMPKMSGEETLNKLKEIDGFETPVIALTADAIEGAEQKYKSKGFIDYIAKPFSKEQIEKKLDKVFKQEELLEEDRLKKTTTNTEFSVEDGYIYD